jgi:hypothetical protein
LIETTYKPVGAILGVAGVIMGWVYRTASSRLGIVDLFAYEITTICRVGTIIDVGKGYSKHFSEAADAANDPAFASSTQQAQAHSPYRFSSSENHFPVFEKNSRDLRVLETGVVTNVTAFYTYMKVVRDYLRRISDLDSLPSNKEATQDLQALWLNLIFMLFLAYEAARKSINDLIEYEPTRTENIAVTLLTELQCYAILEAHFRDKTDDIRCRRLKLRAQEYEVIASDLYHRISHHSRGTLVDEREWAKAAELLDELVRRCHTAGLKLDNRMRADDLLVRNELLTIELSG